MGATLIAGAVLALSPGASAQTWRPDPSAAGTPSKASVEEAKSRYKRGLQLYEQEGQVEAALIELQRAYDLAPNYRVLYNIGQVARSLPDFVTGLRAFERYLHDGGKDIPATRRAEVEKEIAELRERVAALMVTSDAEGATISVDDIPMGRTPLAEPILVNAGRHRISVSKDGRVATKVVVAAGRDSLKVDLPLEQPRDREPTAAPPAPPAPAGGGDSEPEESAAPEPQRAPGSPSVTPPRKKSYTWIGWAATGAFAVGTGVTGALALVAASDLEDARYAGRLVPDDIDDIQNRADTMAIVADIFAAATAVSLGVTLYFSLAGSGGDTARPPPAAGAPSRARPAVSDLHVHIGPGAIQVGGKF